MPPTNLFSTRASPQQPVPDVTYDVFVGTLNVTHLLLQSGLICF